MNYGIHQYGSIANIPGIASLAHGGGYRPYDSGGPLPPGFTLAYNGTGKTEQIFTSDQLRALGEGRGGRGPMGNVYVDTMVVSDRTEADLAARKLAYTLQSIGAA